MDIGGGDIVAYMKTLQKETVNTDNSVKKLDSDLEKLMQKANAAVSKSQAAATRVAGVYGRAGSQRYSGYKPKGIKTPNLGDFSVLPNRKQGNWNEQNSKIDQIPYGSSKFTPAKSPAQMPNTWLGKLSKSLSDGDGKLNKFNKNVFKFQMATLGLGYSFGALTGTVEGVLNSLADLGNVFKSSAFGSKFGGVDVAKESGTNPEQFVQGWKDLQGIMGMVQTTITVIAANMLTPDVMTAITKFFTDLAPVLPDIGKTLGDVVKNCVQFLDSLVKFIPIIDKIVDIFSPWLGVLLPLAVVLGSLLTFFAAIGYVMAGLSIVLPILAPVLAAVSGTVVAVIAGIILLADFIWHLWENLSAGEEPLKAIADAFLQTLTDIYNALMWVISPLTNLLGITGSSSSSSSTSPPVSSTNVNNYIFNGNYSDPNALANQTQTAKAKTG